MKYLWIFITISTFVTLAGSAKANDTGGMGSSGGGELPSFEHNPWFIGTDVVKYCIDQSDKFSRPQQAVEEEIRGALADWVRTIKSREQHPYTLTRADGSTISQSISTEFVQVSCNENPDLTFYIGSYPSQVEDLWRQGFLGNLAAFAKLTSFERTLGRGKGYIWVVPDLADDAHSYQGPIIGPRKGVWGEGSYAFWNVILHEIGHVFGFPHDDAIRGSLMNSDTPVLSIQNARALGQRGVPKYSSETLGAHNWMGAPGSTCGRALLRSSSTAGTLSENDSFLLDFFGIPASTNGLIDVCIKAKFSDMFTKMRFEIKAEQGPLIGFNVNSDQVCYAFGSFLNVAGYYNLQAFHPHVFYPMWHIVDLDGEVENTSHLRFSLRDVGALGVYKLQIVSPDGRAHEATLVLESVTGW